MTTQQVLGTPQTALVAGTLTATASCPMGTQLLGGGFRFTGVPLTLRVTDNSRDDVLVNQWNVTAFLPIGSTITAVAECTV